MRDDGKCLMVRRVQMLHKNQQTQPASTEFNFTPGCYERTATTPNDVHV